MPVLPSAFSATVSQRTARSSFILSLCTLRVGVFFAVLLVQVWRTKYMMILSRRNIFIIMGVVFVAMVGVCMGLQIAAPQVYGYVTSYSRHDRVAV